MNKQQKRLKNMVHTYALENKKLKTRVKFLQRQADNRALSLYTFASAAVGACDKLWKTQNSINMGGGVLKPDALVMQDFINAAQTSMNMEGIKVDRNGVHYRSGNVGSLPAAHFTSGHYRL
jgi:hypothetical protein